MPGPEVAHLQIKVESSEVKEAEANLKGLRKEGAKASDGVMELVSMFGKWAAATGVAATATAALWKLVSVTRQFDILNAGLITATGSLEGAAEAFEAVQEFATTTPYDLGQATEAFTRLVNYGLTPSERALRAYGDTSAAMGKDLIDMVDAVANATTGEFERLKSFGIKARKQGDDIAFTFRGTTTVVKNSAAEIEGYLIRLGETNFGGAMEQRSRTLDGAISNLGDSWDKLFLTISKNDVGGIIEEAVRAATGAIEELTATISSGELAGYLEAVGDQLGYLKEAAEPATSAVKALFEALMAPDESGDKSVFHELLDRKVRDIVGLPAEARAWAKTYKDLLSGDLSWEKFKEHAQEASKATDDFIGKMQAARKKRDEYLGRNDPTMSDPDAPMSYVGEEPTPDRLAGFKVAGSDAVTGKGKKAKKDKSHEEFKRLQEELLTEEEALERSYQRRVDLVKRYTEDGSVEERDMLARVAADYAEQQDILAKKKSKELDALRESLRTEEEAIEASYQKRLEIIRNGTDPGVDREDLTDRLEAEYRAQRAQLASQRQAQLDSLTEGLYSEEEALRQSYERRRQLILESTVATETEKAELLRRLDAQQAAQTAAMEQAHANDVLSAYQTMFGALASLDHKRHGEQSAGYKALFAMSKAFSIAQATLAITTGLAKAQELGFPANLAEYARVITAGASIISTIKSTEFAGAYDQGGQIPAGKVGIVGEYGPEVVRGPATVTGREQTARMLREGQDDRAPQAPPQVNIRQVNVLDPGIVGDYLSTGPGERLIMNVIRKNAGAIRSL